MPSPVKKQPPERASFDSPTKNGPFRYLIVPHGVV